MTIKLTDTWLWNLQITVQMYALSGWKIKKPLYVDSLGRYAIKLMK